jgi:hypothetical protein
MVLLTLKDGTTLQFLYNNGSSLPLMLTTKHFRTKDKLIDLTYQDAQILRDTNDLQALMNVALNETLPRVPSYKCTLDTPVILYFQRYLLLLGTRSSNQCTSS